MVASLPGGEMTVNLAKHGLPKYNSFVQSLCRSLINLIDR